MIPSTQQLILGSIIIQGNTTGMIINGILDVTNNTINLAYLSGLLNNYQQINIQNLSGGKISSSDLVCTNDIGNENINYVDLGINSSQYTGEFVGNTGDAYLFSLSNDFYIGNASGNRLYLFAGNQPYSGIQAGLTVYNNNIGINNINPIYDLDVGGSGNFTSGLSLNGILTISGQNPAINFSPIIIENNAAPASTLQLYAKTIGGRYMTKQVGPAGINTALQPFLARNKVGYWCPPGNAVTLPGVLGFTAYTTTSGTVTARNITTTNLFNRMRRLGFVSAATASGFCQATVPVSQITLGDGNGNGGFYKIIRFGCSDAALVTGARQFCGVSSNITVTQPNIEPSTLTGSIGVGHGQSDSNLMLYYGGTSAQTPISLGSSGFNINTLSVDPYELVLFAPSNSNNTCYYEVTNIASGIVTTGILSGTAGTVLPSSSTLLTYSRNWRCNNGNTKAVALDIMSDYIETDN